MRVFIVNPFDNLPIEGFRPQRYWLMAEAFAAAGHDVTLFTSDFNHTTKRKREWEREVEVGQRKIEWEREVGVGQRNFKLVMIPTKPYRKNVSLARILSHRRFVKDLRSCIHDRPYLISNLSSLISSSSRPDLIIVSLPLIGTAAVALELKRKYGTRVVVDIMDDWPGTFYRLFPRWMRPFARLALAPLRRAAERAYREADLVTGVADRYADLALKAGAKSYKRFYHGINCTPSDPRGNHCTPSDSRGSALVSHSRYNNCFAILYLGNLGRTYDLKTAIDAVAMDERLTLDIAGKGDQEKELKEYARERDVFSTTEGTENTEVNDCWPAAQEGRVRFWGYLGEKEIAELAAKCRFGLVPMSDESCVGVPYKFADYARYGLYILSSLRGESAALLAKHGAGAVYDAGDAKSLIAAALSGERTRQASSVGGSQDTGVTAPSPSRQIEVQSGEIPSLLSEFDAARIYREYVDYIFTSTGGREGATDNFGERG